MCVLGTCSVVPWVVTWNTTWPVQTIADDNVGWLLLMRTLNGWFNHFATGGGLQRSDVPKPQSLDVYPVCLQIDVCRQLTATFKRQACLTVWISPLFLVSNTCSCTDFESESHTIHEWLRFFDKVIGCVMRDLCLEQTICNIQYVHCLALQRPRWTNPTMESWWFGSSVFLFPPCNSHTSSHHLP